MVDVSAGIRTGQSGVGLGTGVGFVVVVGGGSGGGCRGRCESPLEVLFLDKGVWDEGWARRTLLRCHDGSWCIGGGGEV